MAKNPQSSHALEEMRKVYDKSLSHWAANAEPQFYRRYTKLLDRSVDWQEKEFRVQIEDPKRRQKWGAGAAEVYKLTTDAEYPDGQ